MLSKTMLTLSTALLLGAASATLAIGAANAKTNPTAHFATKPAQLLLQPMLPKQTDTNPSNGTLDWVIDHAKGYPSQGPAIPAKDAGGFAGTFMSNDSRPVGLAGCLLALSDPALAGADDFSCGR